MLLTSQSAQCWLAAGLAFASRDARGGTIHGQCSVVPCLLRHKHNASLIQSIGSTDANVQFLLGVQCDCFILISLLEFHGQHTRDAQLERTVSSRRVQRLNDDRRPMARHYAASLRGVRRQRSGRSEVSIQWRGTACAWTGAITAAAAYNYSETSCVCVVLCFVPVPHLQLGSAALPPEGMQHDEGGGA